MALSAQSPQVDLSPSQDPLDSLVRKYLTVNGQLHEQAYEVVQRWYGYFVARSVAVTGQITSSTPHIGPVQMEQGLETPVIGMSSNVFWTTNYPHIIPLIELELCRANIQREVSSSLPDYAFSLSVGQYQFIGYIVSLVQKDGLESWRNFDVELRKLMDKLAKESLGVDK